MPMVDQFYVCRKYSWTDRRQLWAVESRPFSNKHGADDWKEFLQSEDPKRKDDYFVVQIQEESTEDV